MPLTLERTLTLALRSNLGIVSQSAFVMSSTAQRKIARSELLPNLSTAISAELERLNLRTMGVESTAFPASVTFNFYDARAVYVENTYRVKKGQLLVELDPRDQEVSREQAIANLAQAQAGVRAQLPNVPITAMTQSTQVVTSQLSIASTSANLAAAQDKYQSALAELDQAQANEANAKQEAERYRLLVRKDEVSRELADQRITDEHAQAAIVSARQRTASAAQKAVDQAEAELNQARQQAREAEHNGPLERVLGNGHRVRSSLRLIPRGGRF
jgi:multidrug efflux pump subunit AcrA (membrane-fusion protein)